MDEKNAQITKRLIQLYNIDISHYNKSYLQKNIERRIKETHYSSIEAYYVFLEQNREEAFLFSNSFHNNYSKFFRNPYTFCSFEHIVLPSFMHNAKSKGGGIRIWSAACASGQEVYSVAILMEEFINLFKGKLNYQIFATDQCEEQITKATKGRYGFEDLKQVSLHRVKTWFTEKGELYTIKSALKKKIDFSVFNLFNKKLMSPPSSVFGDFDIIFCANLLFYYNSKNQKEILKKVSNNLKKGGYVICGESEVSIFKSYGYKEVIPQSAIFRKE